MKKYQCPPQRQDSSYGDNTLNVDISMVELKRLCSEYIDRLTVNDTEAEEIAKRTVGQSMDVSGEWQRQRRGRLTASVFGEICKQKLTTGFSKLTTRLLYGKYRETKGIRYDNLHEAEARTDYLKRLLVSSPLSSVSITGIHVDTKDCWLGASPDGLVTDPSYSIPNELLEIKCLLRAESTSLHDLSTEKEHCSTFCLSFKDSRLHLKHNHNYYYQIQGQLHVTGRTWCDFFDWTPRDNDYHLERIQYNPDFWKNMYPKLRYFYYNCMLPELSNPKHTSGQPVGEIVDIDISSDV